MFKIFYSFINNYLWNVSIINIFCKVIICNALISDLTYVHKTSSGDARVKCAINKVKIPKVNVKDLVMLV